MPLSKYASPNAVVPTGACDCHMHVFGPIDAYPPSSKRTYTPRPASLAQYKTMATALGLSRAVFVQASAYGADDRCLLNAMAEFGPGARGIAGIDGNTTEDALREMNELGVRGIRINAASRGLTDKDEIMSSVREAVARIAPLGWHLQIFVSLDVVNTLSGFFADLPIPVVFDHMGNAKHDIGLNSPNFRTLLDLLERDRCWVKLAGADRISRSDLGGFSDALPKMRALIDANPNRLVWGSDWPHTGKHGHTVGSAPPLIEYRKLETSVLLDLLSEACGDDAKLKQILVANPSRLYEFCEATENVSGLD